MVKARPAMRERRLPVLQHTRLDVRDEVVSVSCGYLSLFAGGLYHSGLLELSYNMAMDHSTVQREQELPSWLSTHGRNQSGPPGALFTQTACRTCANGSVS